MKTLACLKATENNREFEVKVGTVVLLNVLLSLIYGFVLIYVNVHKGVC